MSIDASQLMARLESLATITDEEGRLTRTFLSPAHKSAAVQIRSWMQEAGMQVRTDAAANVIGRYEGSSTGLPALLVGSHFDSVRNAGIYDGNLGVLSAIACVAALNRQGTRLPFAVEVVAFSEEEGVRYNATLLGSRAIAGTFDKNLFSVSDENGISMEQAFTDYGLDAAEIDSAAMQPSEVLAYIEIHIEQGPVLLDEELPVGIVSAIAGASRYKASVNGLAGHAGTVPMNLRRDALAAASEAILTVEERCAATENVVGTVGQLAVPNGSGNVIAGLAEFSLDIRSGSDEARLAVIEQLQQDFTAISERRNVAVNVVKTHEAPAVACAKRLVNQLCESVSRTGTKPRQLLSGAGHDAMAVADLTDVAMLFVRCGNGGISHNPLETITAEDAGIATRVLLDFLTNYQHVD